MFDSSTQAAVPRRHWRRLLSFWIVVSNCGAYASYLRGRGRYRRQGPQIHGDK